MTEEITTEFPGDTTYRKLIELLDGGAARYDLIDHPPKGITTEVSQLRGHALDQAAKCIVVRVKLGKKVSRFVLAVIPGDRRVDLDKLRQLFEGTYASFATRETAERMAGSVSGTITPFSFNADLELIVDPGVLVHEKIFFNAARLDRSMGLNTNDYVALSQPRIEDIAV